MTARLDPTIRTGRLVLRPILEGDLDDLVAEANHYDVAKMTARIPHPYRRSDARAYFAKVRKRPLSPLTDAVSLTIAEGDKLIGGISLFSMPHRTELGYWLGRSHWGQGFATEAGAALLDYGFGVLNLSLIHCGVALDNPASANVQRKLGFQQVGFATGRSLARGADVEHIHSVLTPRHFRAASLRLKRPT